LKNNIIQLDNIKYVIKSSLSLTKDYYNKFIDYCYKNIESYSKLAINSMIGNFKPNLNKREKWYSKVFTNNSCDAFNSYLKFKGCFIDVKTINNIKYYHTFEKSYSTNLETQTPVYNQILQQEQIELHKLGKLIESNGGIILDYNTDAINCVFEDNKFPFELVEEIQLNNHYWDKNNEVYKYKIEYNKDRLKTSRMQQTLRTDIYKDIKYYNWRLTNDVEDNNFKPLVDKIINSNQSCFITGPGGSGKTTLLKQLQDELTQQDKRYITLCPTNLAALIANGITIHKFSSKLKKQACIKNLDLDYIFIDEVSMLAEVFYKFLMMIKNIKKDIKFIISGDFCQLKPVNDRIPYNTDYANSPCLFELADYNKVQLTKCRRADDTLYNLIKFDNIPNLKPSDFNETNKYINDVNICFTNDKRKEINYIKMHQLHVKNRYRTGLKLDALTYDERSQDVILDKGVPIISKVNNEEMGLINNQRFKIIKLDVFNITIEDDIGNKKDININDFQKFFLPGYATTTHSSQGLSIGEPYTIHEFGKMDQRLKYVSLSRSRSLEYIHIMK
jgi:DNA replication protein DnaC